MRSGNTFLRNYLEGATGVVTGSTQPNDNTLNFQLLAAGLKGEGHLGNDTWFVKTHFPLCSPNVGIAKVKKAVVCVRNPIDTMASYFEFKVTYSQNKTCNPVLYKEHAGEWDWFLREHLDMWSKFYDYWIEIAQKQVIPVYFFRFEDLVADPTKVLKEIFEFTMDQESIEGTYLEKRIKEAIAAKTRFYQPRQGGINMNTHKYSKDQLELIKDTFRDHLNYFGYSMLPSKPSMFSFYELDNVTQADLD